MNTIGAKTGSESMGFLRRVVLVTLLLSCCSLAEAQELKDARIHKIIWSLTRADYQVNLSTTGQLQLETSKAVSGKGVFLSESMFQVKFAGIYRELLTELGPIRQAVRQIGAIPNKRIVKLLKPHLYQKVVKVKWPGEKVGQKRFDRQKYRLLLHLVLKHSATLIEIDVIEACMDFIDKIRQLEKSEFYLAACLYRNQLRSLKSASLKVSLPRMTLVLVRNKEQSLLFLNCLHINELEVLDSNNQVKERLNLKSVEELKAKYPKHFKILETALKSEQKSN